MYEMYGNFVIFISTGDDGFKNLNHARTMFFLKFWHDRILGLFYYPLTLWKLNLGKICV